MATAEPRHPEITVKLIGENGNAFAIIGKVTGALKRAGIAPATINEFTADATSGDYDHLLGVVQEWVEVE